MKLKTLMMYLQSPSSDTDVAIAKGYIAGYLHGCKEMLRNTPYKVRYGYVASKALYKIKIIWPHFTSLHTDLQSIIDDETT